MSVTIKRFEAVVVSNEDEEMRGRIQVTCPGIMGDDETTVPAWVEPVLDWGWFVIPDVGEQVEIEIADSTDLDEIPGQATLEDPVPRWRAKRFHTDVELEDEEDGSVVSPIHKDFETNYPKRRGFVTPWGHTFIFDDTDGDHRIYLTHMLEQLEPGAEPEAEKFTRMEIEPDGSLKLAFLNKHMVHLTTEVGKLRIALDGEPDAEKHVIEFDAEVPSLKCTLDEEKHKLTFDGSVPSLELDLAEGDTVVKVDQSVPTVDAQLAGGDHNMTLDPDQFTANLGGGATVKFEAQDADAKITLGDGAMHGTIVEHLQALWEAQQAYLDSHIHPTGVGPSGPPAAPSEAWDSAINSTKVNIPDG